MNRARGDRRIGGMLAAMRSTTRVLLVGYLATAALCAQMVLWIWLSPGSCSTLFRLSDAGAKRAARRLGAVVPASLVLKYREHAVVCFTHVLPASAWSLLAPFQLHPGWRKRYLSAHRWTGRVFFAASASMLYGYFEIHKRGLHFHLTDFAPGTRGSFWLPASFPFVWFEHVCAAWFAYAGARALFAIVVRRDVARHRFWTWRHVAAGLSVALQRVFVFAHHALFALARGDGAAATPGMQKPIFADSLVYGACAAVAFAEACVRDAKRRTSLNAAKVSKPSVVVSNDDDSDDSDDSDDVPIAAIGRMLKKANETRDDAPAATPMRGRGRPRKTPAAPAGCEAHPPGLDVDAGDAATRASPYERSMAQIRARSATPKRPRGRPPEAATPVAAAAAAAAPTTTPRSRSKAEADREILSLLLGDSGDPEETEEAEKMGEDEPSPSSYVGRRVRKKFGDAYYKGVVDRVDVDDDDGKAYYHVTYEDGDEEEFHLYELQPILLGRGLSRALALGLRA